MTPTEFAAAAHVSRETLSQLETFDAVLLEAAERHNLVARSTLPDRWRRHFLDSAQLYPLIPDDARTVVDVGSGAGFPGLVLAAMGAARGLEVTLVESVGKKAQFLGDAAAAMGLKNVTVRPERIEGSDLAKPDVVTARAVAALPKLLAWTAPLAGGRTVFIFHKGERYRDELTEARKSWRIEVDARPSVTDPAAAILKITGLAPRS
ncbi:MAG: 16S rRNA (guanine(527)-N(7))-methyltransferase RsmG [Pseudomonadota bacterium]